MTIVGGLAYVGTCAECSALAFGDVFPDQICRDLNRPLKSRHPRPTAGMTGLGISGAMSSRAAAGRVRDNVAWLLPYA